MRVFFGLDNLPVFRSPAATVGSYDGVHSGHRVLLDRIIREAARMGGESIVLTFDPHPRITLGTREDMQLLSSLDEKIHLLAELGIDNLIVIPFDEGFSRIPSAVFVREYLIGKIGIKTLVVGFNHRFGFHKEGDYQLLAKLHEEFGFQVTEIEKCDVDSEKVSSTQIRHLIERGEMIKAARMLSHPYLLIGWVDEQGRVTSDDPLKLLPPAGDYPVQAGGRARLLKINSDGGLFLLPMQERQSAGRTIITF